LKVLFCTNAFEHVSNGPAKFANLLASHCFENDVDEIRILTEDCHSSAGKIYKLPVSVPRIFKPFSQFIRMYLYHRQAMKIRNTDYRFDVLVYNNALVGCLSLLLFRRTFGMINDYTNATCYDRSSSFQGESGLKRKVFHHLEKWFCKFSRMPVITNSEFLAKTLSTSYSSDIRKFRILHKGIEKGLLSMNREALYKSKIQNSLLFIKTNFKLAGLDVLAKAIQNFNAPVKLTIAGPPAEYHQEIKSMFANQKVELVVLGHQSQQEIFSLMQSHQIFCLPAYKEAFGVSILEALACGCKVVASNTGGIPEALGKGNWGRMFEPGNALALQKCLYELMDSSEASYHRELEQHLDQFSEENLIANFMKIIQHMA
jgi:colanic acid/amylovoran biosynthesis glycosyltransferase